MAIENGNVVKIHYDAKIGDRIIDTSQNKEPLEFKVGEGQVIKGLDEALVGLNQGEKKTITVPPEKAYGERQEGLVKKMARNKEVEPPKGIEKGNIVRYQTEDGIIRFATVTQVEEDTVTLDLNHPLAGETMTFDIEIVEVKEQ
ncbi:MAG: peptidylprolyl isomerase [Candidatus Bathyarchaeota archaeon]|nr:peptidylprolyl isomerase [Candidatus Bathyarchaeota archaeon]